MKYFPCTELRCWRILLLSGLLFCLAGLLVACGGQAAVEAPTPTPLPTAVVPRKPVYEVARGDIVETLQFSGRVAPVVEQSVAFQAEGVVASVLVTEGDVVAAGQLLAELESVAELSQRQHDRQLTVRRAEIQHEITELELERYRLTTPEDTPGFAQEVGILERRVELAAITLEEAQIALGELEETVVASRLVAPIDGVVRSLNLDPGDRVSAHEPVVVIAQMDQLEITAELGTAEMALLEEGMPVTLAPASRPGETVEGVIRRLPYPYGEGSAEGDDDGTVRINLPQTAMATLAAGDRMRATVVLQVSENTLWLPPQAIRTFEGRRFVVVQDGDVQQRVDVRLGLEEEGRVEILEGLSAGQLVVAP